MQPSPGLNLQVPKRVRGYTNAGNVKRLTGLRSHRLRINFPPHEMTKHDGKHWVIRRCPNDLRKQKRVRIIAETLKDLTLKQRGLSTQQLGVGVRASAISISWEYCGGQELTSKIYVKIFTVCKYTGLNNKLKYLLILIQKAKST